MKVANRSQSSLIGAIDIGSSEVMVIIGKLNDQKYEIIGVGNSVASGIKKGIVVDIDSTVNSIKMAIDEAELMADTKITNVWANVSGAHLNSFNSLGMVPIKNKEVSRDDINKVIETASAIQIPSDQQVLHTTKQEFIIDGQDGIIEPLGMSGVRLEVKVNIISSSTSSLQNIIKCLRRCGLEVENIVVSCLASATSNLYEDEKKLGICLIDFGAGTTDIAIFKNGALQHSCSIPYAGDQITNDIALGLRIPIKDAEDIKKKFGSSIKEKNNHPKIIEVQNLGNKEKVKISVDDLSNIIIPRIEAIFDKVSSELKKSGFFNSLNSGVVITGGSSKLFGLREFVSNYLSLSTRIGTPIYTNNLSDIVTNFRYSTVLGILKKAYDNFLIRKESKNSNNFLNNFFQECKNWFYKNF